MRARYIFIDAKRKKRERNYKVYRAYRSYRAYRASVHVQLSKSIDLTFNILTSDIKCITY